MGQPSTFHSQYCAAPERQLSQTLGALQTTPVLTHERESVLYVQPEVQAVLPQSLEQLVTVSPASQVPLLLQLVPPVQGALRQAPLHQ